MARNTGIGGAVAMSGNAGATNSLINAASVAEALGTPSDSRYLRLTSAGSGAVCRCDITSANLPVITAAKKQSRWVRAVVQIRPTSGISAVTLALEGGSAIFGAPISIPNNQAAATTYTLLYPINGSNGGATYWDGTTLANLKVVFRLTTSGFGGYNIDVEYVALDYGEADGYVDVTPTAAAQHTETGLTVGAVAWTNLANAVGLTTDLASNAATSAQYSQGLDRQCPGFTMPPGAIFQGVEVWDMITPGSYREITSNVEQWPLLATTNTTPRYQMKIAAAQYPRPPVSVTPPGGDAALNTVAGYWVWGGGPGDLFADAQWGTALNGWTGITETNLVNALLGSSDYVSNTSGSFGANAIFWRVYYNQGVVGGGAGPLLFCEA